MIDELIELLRDEKIQEKVKELYCTLKKDLYENSPQIGNYYRILLDKDGNVDYMYSSIGTRRIDEHEGNAICIAIINDVVEFSTDAMGDVHDVEDIEEFKASLALDFDIYEDIDSESEEYEDKKTEYIENRLTWIEYYDFNMEGFIKLEKEAWISICEQYAYDEITDKIYDKVELKLF